MFAQQLINGAAVGSTYALVAIGYSLIFGVLQLINFANGSMYMLGAYITLMLLLAMNGWFVVAMILSVLTIGAVGYIMDRCALRIIRRKNAPKLAGLITTMAFSIVMENFIMLAFGSEAKSFPNLIDVGSIRIGNTIIQGYQVIVMLVAVAVMIVISLLVYKTKFGKSMRSISQNAVAAQLMGVNTSRVISMTFVLSGMLAAIAGVLISMYYQSVDVNMGSMVGMKTFAASVLGGVGSVPGAMLGGLLIGIAETLGAVYISSGYRNAVAFVILIVVLLFKPTGIFGKKNITKV